MTDKSNLTARCNSSCSTVVDHLAEDNALSPKKSQPPKERLAIGARIRVIIENEDKEGLYFDDDRAPWQLLYLLCLFGAVS